MDNDLISREALIKTIVEFHQKRKDLFNDTSLCTICVDDVLGIINNAPTVEQPHGDISDDYLVGYLQGCKDTRDKIEELQKIQIRKRFIKE